MSCGHCEGAVSGEISELAGVTSVKAVASTGEVTVVSAAPLDEEAVRAAVDEAGFELVGTGLTPGTAPARHGTDHDQHHRGDPGHSAGASTRSSSPSAG